MVSYRWRPIADLPDDWEGLARPDLDEMLRLWTDERKHLADPDRARQLEDRLATLWAIETGVIERLYTIDRRTTASLVELGLGAIEQFSTTGKLTQNAASLIEDQRAALDFVFAFIKDDRPLTQSNIRELHQLLMRNQTHVDAVDQFGNRFQAQAQRGIWKTRPNNPTPVDGSIHEYAPVDFVQDEMDQLITMHRRHVELGVPPEVEAAWLHHRFAQIHPFQDGNGRVARALATMIFLKAGYRDPEFQDRVHVQRQLPAGRAVPGVARCSHHERTGSVASSYLTAGSPGKTPDMKERPGDLSPGRSSLIRSADQIEGFSRTRASRRRPGPPVPSPASR